jgi:hypothetical protein
MLSESLSALLIAYTIEYDNEFEHRMPNRTATFGPGGPTSAVTTSWGEEVKRTWLTSKAMWASRWRSGRCRSARTCTGWSRTTACDS